MSEASFESVEAWQAEATRLFGADPMLWRFKCPVCGHIASAQDYKDAGAPSGAVGFSCVGRWTDGARDAFSDGDGPCNYAGGGLFRLNPVAVRMRDGSTTYAMQFAVLDDSGGVEGTSV